MQDIYNPYTEYKKGRITWDQAYLIANNNAAKVSDIPGNYEETDYWARQMESLGVDASEALMKLLGYKQTEDGILYKPEDTQEY